MTKREFIKRFNAYKKETGEKALRLLAVHLNGFTHEIIVDYGNVHDTPELRTFSFYLESSTPLFRFFVGIPHEPYKHAPKEIVFVAPKDR